MRSNRPHRVMVTRERTQERLLGHHDRGDTISFLANLDRPEDDEAADGGSVALENLKTSPRPEIPYADTAIRAAADKGITVVLQSPYATFMPFKSVSKGTGLRIVNMNLGIVAPGQNFVTIEQEASNHVPMVRTERQMLGLAVLLHPGFAD
ncbi:hypothetical protein KC337_g19201 [Hortaea werneckii]|nr:hypothetical protein KC337_g19201 [Hortaea werneckii]